MGLASGLHCLGMCGPLVASFPNKSVLYPWWMDTYHLGRISIYGLLGVVSGFLGSLISFAGFHIFAGFVILLLLAVGLAFAWRSDLHVNILNRGLFQKWWMKAANTTGPGGRAALGAMNGLLPCGMVYFALATSLAWGSTGSGVVFMLSFGLGTLPILLMIPLAGNMLSPTFKRKLKPMRPILLIASLLIVFWRVVVQPMGWDALLPWIETSNMCGGLT